VADVAAEARDGLPWVEDEVLRGLVPEALAGPEDQLRSRSISIAVNASYEPAASVDGAGVPPDRVPRGRIRSFRGGPDHRHDAGLIASGSSGQRPRIQQAHGHQSHQLEGAGACLPAPPAIRERPIVPAHQTGRSAAWKANQTISRGTPVPRGPQARSRRRAGSRPRSSFEKYFWFCVFATKVSAGRISPRTGSTPRPSHRMIRPKNRPVLNPQLSLGLLGPFSGHEPNPANPPPTPPQSFSPHAAWLGL
jgi:hypothetical protein